MSKRAEPVEQTSATFRAAEQSTPVRREALAAYLAGIGLPLAEGEPIRQFAAGFANVNYLLKAGGEWLVLRRPPDGDLPPGAHDMAREHRILSRLWRAFPLAPKGVHLCEDRSVLGVPFQLMAYRPGLSIKGDEQHLFEGKPDLARRTGLMLVDVMAKLHAVDPATVDLDTLGKPDGFFARQVAGWRKRADRVAQATPAGALATEIGDWLDRQTPGKRTPTLLHSDFKLDNVLLAPETFDPVAVVDWDMGTRGDPLYDLATMISYWTEAGDPSCMHEMAQMPTAAAGFPTRREIIAAYGAATGRDTSDFHILRVLAMLKLGVVFLQLHALYERGAAKDPRYATFARLGEELLHFTRDVAHARAD